MTKKIHDQTHLTLDERKIIQTGIENRSNKVDIARTIGKDPTTVAKEIRKHRILKPRNTFTHPILCVNQKMCKKQCKTKCPMFKEIICKQRDRSPGACNKCIKMSVCHIDKYFYYATQSHEEYRRDLVDFREGINLTVSERKQLASILKPLLDQGQSVYQILSTHSEIKQCEKTIYNYIESDVFRDDGINLFSLKEKVQRKPSKTKYKKRKEPVNYTGRKYEDYLNYIKANPNIPTVQMDTVYNNPSGPYIQTFLFVKSMFMIGFIHNEKTSNSMSSTCDYLEEKLGYILYRKLFPLLLTDRGVEFEKFELFQCNYNTGETRSHIFYCDPMQSWQKASIENNHNYVRDIITNELDISNITQEDLNLVFSHINSTPREIFNGKTPYEMFEFLYDKNEFETIIKSLNIRQINRDEVVLKPYLIKHVYKQD